MAKTNTTKPATGPKAGTGKTGGMSTWQLALMTAAAVISLRGLPMMAQEELTMFFYILFATVLFLIPASLVSAELGGAFAAKGGGVYTWVKEAYNKKTGFLAVFLQWIQNVAWYPIVLGFAAAAIAYTIGRPELAGNGKFVGIFSIAVYWLATLLTFKGSSIVSKITSRGFLIGTVLPGIVIVVMALIWLIGGNPVAFKELPTSASEIVSVTAGHPHPRFFPHMTGLGNLAFLAGIVLLFAGVEVQAVHANELRNPQKQYPKAMFIAAVLSFLLFTLGALAMAIITPYKDMSLQAGLMESFRYVFDHYHVGWMTNVVSLLVAFGALAGIMSWIAGPSRGLLWTARDGELPQALTKTNKNGVQKNILFIQGGIVTLLSLLYIFIKDVNVAWFLLSALTAGLYLIMYMLMYASAIKLRRTRPDLPRTYKVPGGNTGMWLVAGIGFLAVLFSFILTFFPPSQLPVGSPAAYTGLVAGGTLLFAAIPLVISSMMARKRSCWPWPSGRTAPPQHPAGDKIQETGDRLPASRQRHGTSVPCLCRSPDEPVPQSRTGAPW